MTTTAPHPVEPPDGAELAQFLLTRLSEDQEAAETACKAQEFAGSGMWMGTDGPQGTIILQTMRGMGGSHIGVLDGLHPERAIGYLVENSPYFGLVDARAKQAI